MKFSPSQYRSMLILFILWSILLIWEALVLVMLFPTFYPFFPAPFSFNFHLSSHIDANPENDLENHVDLSNRYRFIRSLCKNRTTLAFNGLEITAPINLDMRRQYNDENDNRMILGIVTPNMLNGDIPGNNDLPTFIVNNPDQNQRYFTIPINIWENNIDRETACTINGEYGNRPLTRAWIGEALPYPITALFPIMILHMCIFFFILRLDILQELNTQQRAQISLWSNLVVSIILILCLVGYCFIMDTANYKDTVQIQLFFTFLFVLGDFILSFTSMHYMYTLLTV